MKKRSQELRLKNIDKTRNYFLEEIKKNKLMSKKQKKVSTTLNHIEHFLTLASKLLDVFQFLLFLLLLVFLGITSSAIVLNICPIAAVFKKDRSIIKEKGKKAWWNSTARKM